MSERLCREEEEGGYGTLGRLAPSRFLETQIVESQLSLTGQLLKTNPFPVACSPVCCTEHPLNALLRERQGREKACKGAQRGLREHGGPQFIRCALERVHIFELAKGSLESFFLDSGDMLFRASAS